jgi:hypothetical protein
MIGRGETGLTVPLRSSVANEIVSVRGSAMHSITFFLCRREKTAALDIGS